MFFYKNIFSWMLLTFYLFVRNEDLYLCICRYRCIHFAGNQLSYIIKCWNWILYFVGSYFSILINLLELAFIVRKSFYKWILSTGKGKSCTQFYESIFYILYGWNYEHSVHSHTFSHIYTIGTRQQFLLKIKKKSIYLRF